ncbi:hypothetical protein CXB51_003912 [Gossypium anomalum]|uniref:Reverse transcriptase Ty1/copia-type domain-containing protein n=1 Tax=Gossypium anomalum TaxID=47600 RepID=A0A8J6DAH1_9ROSI|nr:hypothetical protein CXB51_003912 [Gossypium anomalum]
MKQHLYAHRLEEGASVHEHLTASLFVAPSYSTFRETILYSCESVTVDEVYDSLTSYDKMKHLVVKPRLSRRGLIIKREAANQRKTTRNSGEADVVEDYSDSELLVTSVNNSKVSEEWILDSGCTFHMSPNWDWFTTYETMSEGVVLMGNNASCKIAGVGTIKVKMFDRVVKTLSDGSTVTGDAAVVSSSLSDDDITKIWHMHLGYMSENGMAELSKRGPLDGVPSRGGANYMLTFIDDFSRKIVQVRRDRETLDSLPYSIAKWRCRTNGQNDHGEGSMYVVKCQLTKVVWAENRDPLNVFFLGYKVGVKGNKLWCPENRKVLISRDVVFDETAILPNLSLKDSSNKDNQKQYAEADLVAYALNALNVAEDIHANEEPSNYSEAKEGTLGVEEPRYKARLVAKGYSQILGVDFTDVFSLVVKHSSIRVLLGIMAMHDLELEQLDVKTIFLHGELEEDIYMQQPEGFIVSEKEDYVCLLKKSLYGLKQSPRQWYKSEEFEMKDLGRAKKILGMEILRDRKESKFYLSQKGYIEKVLCRFNMQSAKPVSTPLAAHFRLSSALYPQSDDEIGYMSHVPYSNAMGSLMYAMVCSHPDLSYAVSAVNRYMANPGKEHWKAVQWILRYLRGITDVACSLEELKMESLGMLMLILLETLIEEDLSQVMSLQSEVVQSVGKPLCKLQSLCLPLKLSTWQLLRLVKKLSG